MKAICCRGGNIEHMNIIINAGWGYGIRSDSTAYFSPIEFMDIHYQKGSSVWDSHIQRALELRPQLTMIPDWERQYTFEQLYLLHNQLKEAGLKTMWTPKQSGIVSQIPIESVIGVSVPTSHGAFLPNPVECLGREIHLLGGEPDAIKYLISIYGDYCNIRSFDASGFVLKAFRGQYWDHVAAAWVQTQNEYSNHQLIEMSAINILEYMRDDNYIFNMRRKPIIRCWAQLNDVALYNKVLL